MFGSVAQGNVNDGSDIDIAERGCNPKNFFSIWGKLIFGLNHPVDLVNLDRQDDFSRFLEEKGELIYVS